MMSGVISRSLINLSSLFQQMAIVYAALFKAEDQSCQCCEETPAFLYTLHFKHISEHRVSQT